MSAHTSGDVSLTNTNHRLYEPRTPQRPGVSPGAVRAPRMGTTVAIKPDNGSPHPSSPAAFPRAKITDVTRPTPPNRPGAALNSAPDSEFDSALDTALDEALRAAVSDVEKFVDGGGWDSPRQLFALVPTAELLAHEPGLLGQIELEPGATATPGLDGDAAPQFTPVEQGEFPGDTIADALARIAWPDEIAGCILVLEIMVGSGDDLAEGRMAVGVMRGRAKGACALRWRHAPDGPVTYSPDLAPELVAALQTTFE